MKIKRMTAAPMAPSELARIKAIRASYQARRPTLSQLLESGEYDGPYDAQTEWVARIAVARLRRLRESRGIAQRDLARRIGMDPSELSRIETGRQGNLTLQTLGRIARGLGYEPRIVLRKSRTPAVDIPAPPAALKRIAGRAA